MLIDLMDDVSVAAEDVSELETDSHRNRVKVTMRGGNTYWVPPDYGKSVCDKHSQLRRVINGAMACPTSTDA